MATDPITVLGAGSWGTALAIRLATRQDTLLWGHEPDAMATLTVSRENSAFLPGIRFPERLTIEADLASAVQACRDLLIVVPSHAFREVIRNVEDLLDGRSRIAWATKGLEHGTGKFMSDVLEEELGSRFPAGSDPACIILRLGQSLALPICWHDSCWHDSFKIMQAFAQFPRDFSVLPKLSRISIVGPRQNLLSESVFACLVSIPTVSTGV